MKIRISENAESKFRQAAMKRFGYTKGALSEAAEQALGEWSERQLAREEVRHIAKEVAINDIVSELRGVLKHVKGKSSVALQHEARKIRVKQRAGVR